MADKAELRGKVSLDTGAFHRGLRAVKQSFNGMGADMGRAFVNLRTAALVGTGAAAAGFALAVRAVAKYDDEVGKASQRTGIAADELSRLRYAAEGADVDFGTLEGEIRKAMDTLANAAGGQKQSADALKRLGLEAKDLAKLTPEAALDAMLTALAAIPNAADQTAAALDVFGKSGTALLPMLAEGADGLKAMKERAGKLGLVVTPKQAQSAARFGDAITDLKASFLGLLRNAIDLDKFAVMFEKLTGAVIAFRNSATFAGIRAGFVDFVQRVLDGGARLVKAWNSVDAGTRFALMQMAMAGAAFVTAWRLGFIAPLLSGMVKLVGGWKVLLVGFAAFIVGYKIGSALEKAFNLSGMLLNGLAWAQAYLQMWEAFFSNLGAAAILWGQEFVKALTPGEDADFSGVTKQLLANFESEGKAIGAALNARTKAIDAAQTEEEKNAGGAAGRMATAWEELKKEFASVQGWKDDLGGIVDMLGLKAPDALEKFLAAYKDAAAAKFDVEAFDPTPFKQAAQAAKDVGDEARKAQVPLRGFFSVPGIDIGTMMGTKNKKRLAFAQGLQPILGGQGANAVGAQPVAAANRQQAQTDEQLQYLKDLVDLQETGNRDMRSLASSKVVIAEFH